MKEDVDTKMAEIITFARAYHSMHDDFKIFDDYLAKQILDPIRYSEISNQISSYIYMINPLKQLKYKKIRGRALKEMVHRLVAPMVLARDRYIEDLMNELIYENIEQFVIIGAGFDTFGFRKKTWLDKLTVYEINNSLILKNKLNRIKKLGWSVHEKHKFIEADINEKNIYKKLVENGFDKNKRTLFSMLGVTYYFTQDIFTLTLNEIKDISQKGSYIVIDFFNNNLYRCLKKSLKVNGLLKLLKNLNAPIKTTYSYGQLEKEFIQLGYDIEEYLCKNSIQRRYFKGRDDDYSAFENFNILCVRLNK